jgi:hypothetical protein
MKRLLLPALLVVAFCSQLCAQGKAILSDSSLISLMTVAPGEELYSTFGHSAIRVYDPLKRIDVCYNYGTFDFDQPNFYVNFCRGKLLYSLDVEPTRNFEYGNIRDRRNMREQTLNLTTAERQRLFDLLQTNALAENRNYKYDFFYDNCATRIRDIVKETFFHQIAFDSTTLLKGTTMRQLLHQYLGDKPWTRFGMDLVLGIPADHKARAEDFMFLPDYIHRMFATTKLDDGRKLVLSERVIPERPFPNVPDTPDFFTGPLFASCLFALLGLLAMANPRTEAIFDTLFWFILGFAGLIIALLWFATDHSATKTNLNILWALPTHLLYFWRRNRSEWVENYFTGAALLAALTLLFWVFIPQDMPVEAIPIAGLVVVKGLWRRHWKKGNDEMGDVA